MMSGKKGKGGRPLLSNMMEGMGELGSQKIGKWLGDFILSLTPGLTAALGGLNKDSVLDFVPYLGTFFLKNEILQDSSEGFLRGLAEALRSKRNDIPDDPAQQKAFFVSLLGPSFDKLKTDLEGKKGNKPKGLLVAAAGLELSRQSSLWTQIRESGEMDEILKVAFGSDITTDELRAVLTIPETYRHKWLRARLTPAPKPVGVMDRIQKVTNRLGAEGEKYLDPKSSEWTGAIGKIEAHTTTVDMSLDFINRNTKR